MKVARRQVYSQKVLKSKLYPENHRKPLKELGCMTGLDFCFQSKSSFFRNSFIYFNQRLITLQFCGGFCHNDMNQPWVYMCPPSRTTPSPSHPSGLSQCTSFECPVSCIELGLVIPFTYGNIHVSMLFSQILPLLPSPTEFKSLFFISVSLLLSHVQGHSKQVFQLQFRESTEAKVS